MPRDKDDDNVTLFPSAAAGIRPDSVVTLPNKAASHAKRAYPSARDGLRRTRTAPYELGDTYADSLPLNDTWATHRVRPEGAPMPDDPSVVRTDARNRTQFFTARSWPYELGDTYRDSQQLGTSWGGGIDKKVVSCVIPAFAALATLVISIMAAFDS